MKRGIRAGVPAAFLMLLCGILCWDMGTAKAATSYTNAREFYESTGKEDKKHCEIYAGDIYFATCGKLASSSTNLKYGTVGYDIKLSGNGGSVEFSIKRNGDGTMQEVPGSGVLYDGYEYNLYRIPASTIFEFAGRRGQSAARDLICQTGDITVSIDSIMTTKQGTQIHGSVAEDGNGGLQEWGTIYHLKDGNDLAAIRAVFAGHTFESFFRIQEKLFNYQLSVRYHLQGGTVGNGYSSIDDMLCQNGSQVMTKARLLQPFRLFDQDTAGLVKPGYHTEEGREWVYENVGYSDTAFYMPKEIEPNIGLGDHGITMYANWQANTYTIRYEPNGGSGYMSSTAMVYDVSGKIRRTGYTRRGYTFRGWNTEADGSGISYGEQQEIRNLTEEPGGSIVLYAQWEPNIYTIVTEKQEGSGGTDIFYEKYEQGWYSDKEAQREIPAVSIPHRTGYDFGAYHTSIMGLGNAVTDQPGNLVLRPDHFVLDSIVYANWKPKVYTITFDRQGGIGGTEQATATYGAELPLADGPVRKGYSFKGYYTSPGGAGELYYNEFMAAARRYRADQDITLYACWVDDISPDVTLTANIDIWTNRGIVLSAVAYDFGSGPASLVLYQGDRKVAETKTAAGSGCPVKMNLDFPNRTEGAITYKAVAVDQDGNRAEAFRTVFYDITPPKGMITKEMFDGQVMELEVFVDDWNVK